MKLSKLRASNSHRMVGGTKVPKAGMSGFGMRRASGGACSPVEGEKPKMRLDRPMRAKGGRVKRDAGGMIPGDAGGMVPRDAATPALTSGVSLEDIKSLLAQKGADTGGAPPMSGLALMKQSGMGGGLAGALGGMLGGRKSGGRVEKTESKASAMAKHDDEEEDKALMRKMVKPSAMRAKGGNVKKGC